MKKYIGCDMHKKYLVFVTMDEHGHRNASGSLQTTLSKAAGDHGSIASDRVRPFGVTRWKSLVRRFPAATEATGPHQRHRGQSIDPRPSCESKLIEAEEVLDGPQ